MRKAPKGSPLHPLDERINRIIAMVRARVEHPFRVIKRQFGHVKTRYRGLAKNRAQLWLCCTNQSEVEFSLLLNRVIPRAEFAAFRGP